MSGTPRELTYGEKAVGLTFNPSGDPQVQKVKAAFAAIIDDLDDMRSLALTQATIAVPEVARMLSVAITEAQAAQMWAVKAITWK